MWRPWKSPQRQSGQSKGTVYCSKKIIPYRQEAKKVLQALNISAFIIHFSEPLDRVTWITSSVLQYTLLIPRKVKICDINILWNSLRNAFFIEWFLQRFFHWLLLDRLPQLHSWCKSSPADRRSAISSSNFYEFIIRYKWIGKRFPNS